MESYLSISELADYIKMSKSTIYKRTAQNLIPFIKCGKNLLFKKETIDQWLQEFSQPTVKEVRQYATAILKSKRG